MSRAKKFRVIMSSVEECDGNGSGLFGSVLCCSARRCWSELVRAVHCPECQGVSAFCGVIEISEWSHVSDSVIESGRVNGERSPVRRRVAESERVDRVRGATQRTEEVQR